MNQIKLNKIPLINGRTLNSQAGYGLGRTKQEAIENALIKARKRDPHAFYREGQVWFDGGINC